MYKTIWNAKSVKIVIVYNIFFVSAAKQIVISILTVTLFANTS